MKFVMRTIILLVLFMVASFAQTTKAVAMHIHRSAWTTLQMNGYKPTLYPNLYLNASLTQKIQKTDIRQLQEGQPVWLPVTATVNHQEVAEWLAWENATYSPTRVATRQTNAPQRTISSTKAPDPNNTVVTVTVPSAGNGVQKNPAPQSTAQPKSAAPKQNADRTLGGSRKNGKQATGTNTSFFIEVVTVIAWTVLLGAICALLMLAYNNRQRIRELLGKVKFPKIKVSRPKMPDWHIPRFKVTVPKFKFGLPQWTTKVKMPSWSRFWDWVSQKLDEFLDPPGSKDQPVYRIPSIFTQPYSQMDMDTVPTMRTVPAAAAASNPPDPVPDPPRYSHIQLYDTVILDGNRKDPSIPTLKLSTKRVIRKKPGSDKIAEVVKID